MSSIVLITLLLIRGALADETTWLHNPACSDVSDDCQRYVDRALSYCSDAPGHGWLNIDYLMWWTRGVSLPPLVTTSPAVVPRLQAGVLGNSATTVLFGGDRVNDAMRNGLRLDAGVWFDCPGTNGLEFDFFALETSRASFVESSGGDPILARPFVDAVTGRPSAELVAYPGIVRGDVQSAAISPGLWGWGLAYRKNLSCCTDCCGRCGARTDWLIGYRHLRLDDRVVIRENLDSPLLLAGTDLSIDDRFSARNAFHGLELGLVRSERCDTWELDYFAKAALGWNDSSVRIRGETTVASPGFQPVINDGGLLALGSNSGRFDETHFAAVLQVGTNLAYRVTEQLSIRAGYTLLFWPEVFRAGDQIDTTINPHLLPPPLVPLVGPARPSVLREDSNFWCKG